MDKVREKSCAVGIRAPCKGRTTRCQTLVIAIAVFLGEVVYKTIQTYSEVSLVDLNLAQRACLSFLDTPCLPANQPIDFGAYFNHIVQRQVDAGKTDVGHLVHLGQPIQHEIADDFAFYFGLPHPGD